MVAKGDKGVHAASGTPWYVTKVPAGLQIIIGAKGSSVRGSRRIKPDEDAASVVADHVRSRQHSSNPSVSEQASASCGSGSGPGSVAPTLPTDGAGVDSDGSECLLDPATQ
eukprot:1672200-Prymnesium_polylepis.1